MMDTARFQYSLQAVLRMRERAMDSSRSEELNARRVVVEKQEEASKSRALVSGLEQQMREMLGEGRNFDLQRRGLLAGYLESVRQRLTSILSELTQAEKVHEQTRLSLQAHAQKVRALERHREAKQAQHSKAVASAEYKTQDELWLVGIVNRS